MGDKDCSSSEKSTEDELLAEAGYNVTSSELPEIADIMERLERVISTLPADDDVIAHLSDSFVHQNPSDLSGWINSLLSEVSRLQPPPSGAPTTKGKKQSG